MKNLFLPLGLFLCLAGAAAPALAGGIPRSAYDLPRGLADDPQVNQVPWKALLAGQPDPPGLLLLYWFPASAKEPQASSLQASRELTAGAAHCVGMVIVADDDTDRHERYKVAADVSTVVLVSASGSAAGATADAADAADAADRPELGRVAGREGRPAGVEEVERLLREGLKRQEKAAEGELEAARAKADQGDRNGAIALYTKVWNQLCLLEGPAKTAAKALRKLGQPVPDR